VASGARDGGKPGGSLGRATGGHSGAERAVPGCQIRFSDGTATIRGRQKIGNCRDLTLRPRRGVCNFSESMGRRRGVKYDEWPEEIKTFEL
jgi:hypothetical protein